jgi:hypothetical protein
VSSEDVFSDDVFSDDVFGKDLSKVSRLPLRSRLASPLPWLAGRQVRIELERSTRT